METSSNQAPKVQEVTKEPLALGTQKRYKLVMLGETSTGKTSLATRFSKKIFHEWQESTIGAAYLTGTVKNVMFEIWDTAGQERYHSLAPMYYRGAKAAIVVYDITNSDSFDRAKDWIGELRKNGPEGLVAILAGNKADLGTKREVAEADASAWADQESVLFMETSAKSGFCVEEIFSLVATRLLEKDGALQIAGQTAVNLEGSSNENVETDGVAPAKCC